MLSNVSRAGSGGMRLMRALCSMHPKKSAKGPITWLGLGLMAVTGTGLIIYYQHQKDEKTRKVMTEITTTGKAALGGPFVLVNHEGKPVSDATFKGKFLLVYFGFTYCPDICPNELVKIGKVIEKNKMLNKFELTPVFISVDPGRDTIAQLKHYRKDFHPSFEFLTGTPEQIAAVTKAFRVYFSKVNEEEDQEYLVDHSIVVYLLSDSGEFLEFFTQSAQVADIVERIGRRVKSSR